MSGEIAALSALVAEFMDARDWEQYHSPKNLAAAIAVEAAELQEIYLWRETSDLAVEKRTEVEEEVADIAICLLNFCNRTGIDLDRVIRAKLEVAAARYPADRVRGRREKYDEYDEFEEVEAESAVGAASSPSKEPSR